jgi:rhodanese-related sulfurtransferase
MLFVFTSCDNSTEPVEEVNEAEVLVKYLEANGDPVASFPPMITAESVFGNLGSTGQVVIDIRSADSYNAGHIEGAVNVDPTKVLEYYEDNNLESKTTVVIACVTGQTAGWVNGLLRLAGKTNTFDLKWGMCSWNEATSAAWTNVTVDPNALDFVTSATAKPDKGSLPKLETGKTSGADILRNRVEAVFAEGFDAAKITNSTIYVNPANYFIINYWSEADYNWGHINGAMQYTPGTSLKLDNDLKTISTTREVAVYCYTGQTSAHVAAFLRVMGYNAKSILYGVNDMNYETMPSHKFVPSSEVKNYPLVK